MELSAREDIEAPLDQVFAALTDFDAIERQVLRRGIEIRRTTDAGAALTGMAWSGAFTFRGKQRQVAIELTECNAPEHLLFNTISGGLEGHSNVELVALSRGRTRINVVTTLAPKTLSARLLVQSLKLARGNIEKKFRNRMGLMAKELETRLRG